MSHGVMDRLQSDDSGADSQERPHSHQALDELKRVLGPELNQRFQEDIEAQETAKEAYTIGLIKNYVNSLGMIDRSDGCEDLAVWLWDCWETDHHPVALTACIEVERELLDLRPAGHSDRAQSCINLAASLGTRFEHTGDTTLLDDATRLQQEALDLCPAGHPLRAKTCRSLASSLWTRYKEIGDATLLDMAIKLEEEALDLCPVGHADHPRACENLALSLCTRYNHTGDTASLDKAVMLQDQVLHLRPTGHPDRARSCANLAASLWEYYRKTGDNALLDKVIDLREEVLHLHPAGHPDRAASCASLADSLWKRYNQTGNTAILDKAIELQEEALHLRPIGHPDRAISCASLAVPLKIRYTNTGEIALLDKAIQLEEEALKLCPVGHPDRASFCVNYADSLWTRYNRTGDAALLNEATKLHEEALDLRPVGHPRRAESCASVASSLWTRYNQTGDTALLNKAVALEEEALDLTPSGHPDRALACRNLAISLFTRFEWTGDTVLLNEAIKLHEEALDLHPDGHPDRANSCANLASSLWTQYNQTGNTALLDRAIALNHQALSATTSSDPVRWRYSLDLARLGQISSPHPDWQVIINHFDNVFNASSYDDMDALLKNAVKALLEINPSWISLQQQQALFDLHARAIDIVVLAAGIALETLTQLQHINNGVLLGPAALTLALQLNQLPSGIQLLERARGVIWSQKLHLRNPQLDRVPKELATNLRGLLHSTSVPRGRSLDYTQRNQLQDVILQIRSLPGLNDFMRGPSVEALLNSAASSCVVLLVAHELAGYALIFTSSNPVPTFVLLPGITRKAIQGLTMIGFTSQKRGLASEYHRDHRYMKGIQDGMLEPNARLAKVWRMVVKPVITQLGLSKTEGRARPRIHWCPTGSFAFVPVHAAGMHQGANRECCSDYFVSSYTPTLTALLRAQEGQRTFPSDQIKLLAIAAEYAHDSSGPRLQHVLREVQKVLYAVEETGVLGRSDAGAGTTGDVVEMIKSANLVHFACHGNQHHSEPHKSHFCLTTGNLSVTELMEVDLENAFFAFLSACETAKGDTDHADEVVHLAATMLFAGFKSVVATMWAMRDEDGPFIAQHFYQKLFEGKTIDIDAVPYALDDAVSALRGSGASPERWATFIHMGA